MPDVGPHRGALAEPRLAGDGSECLGVGLVGVETAQLLGQQVTGRPLRERCDRVQLVADVAARSL